MIARHVPTWFIDTDTLTQYRNTPSLMSAQFAHDYTASSSHLAHALKPHYLSLARDPDFRTSLSSEQLPCMLLEDVKYLLRLLTMKGPKIGTPLLCGYPLLAVSLLCFYPPLAAILSIAIQSICLATIYPVAHHSTGIYVSVSITYLYKLIVSSHLLWMLIDSCTIHLQLSYLSHIMVIP